MPWQRLKQESSTSTGFVIDGRRIITNAHSVEYSTMIQVKYRSPWSGGHPTASCTASRKQPPSHVATAR